MNRRITALLLAGTMALSIFGCGDREPEQDTPGTTAETQQAQEKEAPGETERQTEAEPVEEEGFSFDSFADLRFCFSSGAGAWSTLMTVRADGSFSGEYWDSDMGDTGEGYPGGTVYRCDFAGEFTEPVKVNDYTYSMQIRRISYEKEAGTEEIQDGVRYCYSDAYGLDEAKDILIYLPGGPLDELPEEYRSWVGYYDLTGSTETELPFYGLYNENAQCGFSSYDMVESFRDTLASVEASAAELESSLAHDALTQTELNDKTDQLYQLWDSALNQLWSVLKQTLDEKEMEQLLTEQREWIAEKEAAAAEAGAEYEGGSMQPMAVNLKAAELTRDRVYELLELLE